MEQHVDISHISGYQTPALARYFVTFDGENTEEIRAAAQFAHQMKLPILTIAGGKNSLFAFDEYEGLVIQNISEGYDLNADRRVKVLSGQSIWDLAETLEIEHGLSLWHRFQ